MATNDPESPEKRGKKGLLLAIFAVLISTAVAVAGTLYMAGQFDPAPDVIANQAGDQPASSPRSPVVEEARYADLSPAFVINYNYEGELRYVQLSVSVMARSDDTLEVVENHLPRIRNSLILLFSDQDFETLGTPQGKERLQQLALESIRETVREEGRVPDVEAVYFTNFVMQ